eukprot:TRINITY_DN1300_c0_g1_i1.p1 TRINITY_DN1300_c0_g1~~TRINITY_DN1300_c0_g1_i1.p1  ORF type:complete len:376 (-),score=86.06 TRINITY_DN1300_c0_g1_i1:89-1216(-)
MEQSEFEGLIEEDQETLQQDYQPTLTELDYNRALRAISVHCKAESPVSIILLSRPEIQKATGLTQLQIDELLTRVSFQLCENITSCSALDLSKDPIQQIRLGLGCPIIDTFWNGGILLNGITEISGESSSGKTQICLQLAIRAQLPVEEGGLGGSSLYISTEGDFPFKRLKQMVVAFKRRYPSMKDVEIPNNIFTEKTQTVDNLTQLLEERLPVFLSQQNVKLVIIDSMAALFRHEFTREESIERSKILAAQASKLKIMSDSFNLPIVVVNHVTDLFDDSPFSTSKKIPTLGLFWSNCVNTRILVVKTNRKILPPPVVLHNGSNSPEMKRRKLEEEAQLEVAIRKMHITLSSHLPNNTCSFIVEKDGVRGIRVDN